MQPRRPDLPEVRPIDVPMVPIAIAGLLAWVAAGLVLLLFRSRLVAHGNDDWLWICLAGFLVGLPGLVTMIRHDANRARRLAARQEDQP